MKREGNIIMNHAFKREGKKKIGFVITKKNHHQEL